MADKRISQLVERVNIANNDVLPIVASGATTTNKVTVSTLQDWMQSNLDVGVTSVGLSMPSAFVVSNSPVTASGNISVTGAGTVSQYIRGDGSLADFPSGGGGGGSSVNYYLNGSVSQGTIGGIAYQEMNKVPVLGAGTDFTIAADGYIASFITDAGDPALLEIPAGNWNFETYLQASSGGGTPSFYIELYKVNSGGTATLIASNSATPELIAFGTTTTPYFSALAVPTTSLALTDRLALRYYVTHSGRTITLHTENATLCQIVTTFTTGLTALNGLTAQVQNFATGTSGTDFAISSSVSTHTFNLPNASASARGVVTTGTQTFAGEKTFSNTITVNTPTNGLSTIYNGRSSDSVNIIRFNSNGASSLQNFIQSTPNDLLIGTEGNTPIYFVTNNGGVGGGLRLTISGSGSILAQGSFEANSIRKTGGTSSQFLKADGSVDSSTYLTTGSAGSTYVPYSGATSNVDLGVNTFTSSSVIVNGVGSNAGIIHLESNAFHSLIHGYGSISSGTTNQFNLYQTTGAGVFRCAILSLNSITASATRTYTLPDADGTLALTSDLSGYVTLATTQTITGNKSIITGGGGNTLTVSQTSGTGVSLSISKYGNGEGLKVEKFSGSGNAVTITGGLLSAEAATLTGALNGTSATFRVSADRNLATKFDTNIALSAQSDSGAPESLRIYSDTFRVFTATTVVGLTERLTISNTGAATFSSSVRIEASDDIIRFGNLLRWGFQRPTTDNRYVSFVRNANATATPVWTVDGDNGNVGIGGNNPFNEKLYIEGNANLLTLSRPGAAKTYGFQISSGGNFTIADYTASVDRMIITSGGNVGIGAQTPTQKLHVESPTGTDVVARFSRGPGNPGDVLFGIGDYGGGNQCRISGQQLAFEVNRANGAGMTSTTAMFITSGGDILVGATSFPAGERMIIQKTEAAPLGIDRRGSDGGLLRFYQDGTEEGNVTVSGSTVSYNGGHLSRYTQTESNEKIDSIVKGTVMSNLDQMAVWINPETGEPYENEQLNCMKISDIEGDKNVAGVFVNWDNDDQLFTNDMNIAMTGDMIIRIAEGVVVEKGDLLISSGDGTAKPQSDDLIRSNTIAKVTSNHVTCVYEDGSYCVPCVLMAC